MKLTTLSFISSLIAIIIQGYIGVRFANLGNLSPINDPQILPPLNGLSLIFSGLALIMAIAAIWRNGKKISGSIALLLSIFVLYDVITSIS